MIDLRNRLRGAIDKLLVGCLVLILFGSSLAFGGSTWWARPAIAAAIGVTAALSLLRVLLLGKWSIAVGPLPILGLFAVALSIAQLVPFPAAIAQRLSPRSRALYSLGVLPEFVHADDPQATLPEPAAGRSPVAIDRAATLRGLAAALVCLALFRITAGFADRLSRLLVVWGCIVGTCTLHAVFGIVQVAGNSNALYGIFETGKSPPWAPNADDILRVSHSSALRPYGNGSGEWALPVIDRGFSIGGLLGGPAAFRALAVLALPLALAILLQLLAPRGSRLKLRDRLRESGHGGAVATLMLATAAIALFFGMLSGPWLCLPPVLGLLAVGLFGGWSSGFRWGSLALATTLSLAIAGGCFLGEAIGRPAGVEPLADRAEWNSVEAVWKQAARVAGDFPVLGVGLGGFPTILSYVKQTDHAPSSALSSLLQWTAEMGLAGLIPLGLAALWCLIRLPRAFRRVGKADRPLAGGLLGAVAAFAVYSTIQNTLDTPAIALAAAAVLGNFDRWLRGGTDLFVQG